MPLRRGRKSLAQTPAPPKERIKGSKKNPKGSAASDKSASTIKLSESIIEALQGKLAKFKEENPSKKNITLNDLKAVYRRGAGAYSSSHRPTISGGKPNTRNAWAMARVNKFLKKAAGEEVKKAYVQDDDLLENGGVTFKGVEQLANYVHDRLIELGIKQERGLQKSVTSYGTSYYIVLYHQNGNHYKLRISDHSVTNVDRIKNEIHITDRNVESVLNELEKVFYPERYEMGYDDKLTKVLEYGLKDDDIVVGEAGVYRGEKIYLVKRKKMVKKKSFMSGGKVKQDSLLKAVFQEVKRIFNANGLIINEDYSFTDGSNKSYLPYFSYMREGEMIKKATVTYYEEAYEILGEVVIEVEDDKIEIEVEFPNWNIDEEVEFEEGGMVYSNGGEITSETTAAFNRKMKRELPSIKRQVIYDGYSGEEIDKKVNENIAYKYMQYVATKLGMKFGEIEFENKSKEPTNHFQLVCSVWDDKNDYILWATFVYVNDNHQVDESQTNMQLLNLNYEHVKTIHEEPPYFEQGGDILIQDTVARMDNLHLADAAFYKEGGLTDTEKTERYKKWKSLVNMSKGELKRFYDSEEGKVAGLTPSQAKAAGIDSGRESARWIMKMKETPVSKWTPEMWRWAGKQISFISRMSGVKGGLYDDKGRKTRKHLSLLIWGHNPEKYGKGGKVNKPIDEFIFTPENTHESINVLGNLEIDPLIGVFNDGGTLNSKTYTMDIQKFNSLPHIDTLKVGDTILLKEAAITNKGVHAGERFIKAQVERIQQLGKINTAVLKVLKSVGDMPVSNLHIQRPVNNIMKLGRSLTQLVVPDTKSFKDGGQLEDLYIGDEIDYKGKRCEVMGLSGCRNYIKVKNVTGGKDEEIGIDELMDNAKLLKRR